jgi:chemotaxis protein MotB
VSKGRNDAPIIVRPRKVVGHGHHGGAWKVAFADFMTAMFAMFLVLWLDNQSSEVRDAVANYFRDPLGFESGGVRALATTSAGPGGAAGSTPVIVPGPSAGPVRSRLEQAGEAIQRRLRAQPALARLGASVRVEMTPEGLRIAMAEAEDGTFFDSGSAALRPSAAEVLRVVGAELGALDTPVMIEGHTDARPLRGRAGYTNWELSTDRAHAARRVLEASGLDPRRVAQVRGFADQDLLDRDDPLSSRNRRITITALLPSAGGGPR